MNESTTPSSTLRGLILIGGRSKRMGTDKSMLNYHGLPQRDHLANLLRPLCQEVFLSCRPGQEVKSETPLLPDAYVDVGPFAALLTAFELHPDSAWLVVACDLPLVDSELLLELISARDPNRMATAFRNVEMDFPEPLITIWEPATRPEIQAAMEEGKTCPRRLLGRLAIKLLDPSAPEKLLNANRPDEVERIRAQLHSQSSPTP